MTTDRPTIYLSNWASLRTPGHHGPGRILSIMVKTPHWATPDGKVEVVVPNPKDLWAARDGSLSFSQYRERYTAQVSAYAAYLVPGEFVFQKSLNSYAVKDGDTLCCSCSREKAADGKCHRTWLTPLLGEAGWRVVLDGKEIVFR